MNWKNEAKEKLGRYDAMRMSLITLPDEIKRLEIDAKSIRSSRTDATPVAGGGNKREDAMLNNIIHRQELEWNKQLAELWVHNVDRALSTLDDEERLILYRFFINPERGAMERLSQEIGAETSTLYRKREKALRKFTIAYYGAVET